MDFVSPNVKGFTIYSKSGCPNCTTVKKLIKNNHFLIEEINCDEYILEDKEKFLIFIESLSNKSWKTFPIVFFDGSFIGGLYETIDFIDKLLLSFEENF
jgi:glutaredoxin